MGALELAEELVAGDLVEYEEKEGAYYLSYDGFEVIRALDEEAHPQMVEERVSPGIEEDEVAPLQQLSEAMGGPKKLTRMVIVGIFLVAVAFTLLKWLDGYDPAPAHDNLPDSTVLERMQEQADSAVEANR